MIVTVLFGTVEPKSFVVFPTVTVTTSPATQELADPTIVTNPLPRENRIVVAESLIVAVPAVELSETATGMEP